MKVLYVTGVAMEHDATTEQLTRLSPDLKITTVTSAAEALAETRTAGGFRALLTSPWLAHNDTLSLIVSLRRDRVPIAIVPVLTEAQRDFFASAVAAGADDVLLLRGDQLLRANETLTRIRQSPHLSAGRERRRLRVLYAGVDDRVWTLLEQVPFVVPERAAMGPDGSLSVRQPGSSTSELKCDVVVIDQQAGETHPLQVLKSVKGQASDLPVILLAPAGATDVETAALDLGADDTVIKSGIYRRRLIATLRRVHQRFEIVAQHQILRAREARLRQIVESLPQGVAVIGEDCSILAMNGSALALFNAAKPTDVVGRDFRTLVADADRDEVTATLGRVSGGAAATVRFALATGPADSATAIELAGVPLERDARGGRGIVAVFRTPAALDSGTRAGTIDTDDASGVALERRRELERALDEAQRLAADSQQAEAEAHRLEAEAEALLASERKAWETERRALEARLEEAESDAARRGDAEAALADVLTQEREAWDETRRALDARAEEAQADVASRLAAAEAARLELERALEGVRATLREVEDARIVEAERTRQAHEAEVGDARRAHEAEVADLRRAHALELADLTRAHETTGAQMGEALEAERESWSAERAELTTRLHDLQTTLDAMARDLQDARSGAASAQDAEIERLRIALAAATTALDEARRGSDADRHELAARIDAVERERDALRDDLARLHDERSADRTDRNAMTRELESRLADAGRRTADLEQRLAALDAERELIRHDLQGRLDSALADLRTALEARAALEGRVRDLETTRQSLEAGAGELASLRQALDEVRRALDQTQHERDEVRRALDQTQHERDDVRRALDQTQVERDDVRRALDQTQHERDDVRRALDQTQHERDEVRRALDRTRHDLDQATRGLDEQVGALRRELDAARQEIDGARATMASALDELSETQARADVRTLELRDREATIQSLEEQVRQSDALIRDHVERVRSMEEALRSREADLRDREAQLEALRDEQQAGHSAAAEALQHELRQLTADHAAERGTWEALQQDYERRINDTDGRLRALDATVEEMRAERDRVAAERDALTVERDRLAAEHDRLNAGRQAAAEDARRARHEADAMAADRRTLESQAASLESLKRDLEARALDAEAGRADLERRLSEAAALRDTLERQLRDAETARAVTDQRSRAADAEREALLHEIRTLGTEHARLLSALEAERLARVQDRTEIEVVRQAFDHERTRRIALREQLQDLEAAVERHRAAHVAETDARRAIEQQTADATRQHLVRVAELDARVRELVRDLDEERALRQRATDSPLVGVARTTRDGRLVDCNDTFARFFGLASAADAIARHRTVPVVGLTPMDTRGGATPASGVHEISVTRPDGHVTRLRATQAPARGADGTDLVEHVVVDASATSRLEDQLRQARRLEEVGSLAASMAPDIEARLMAVSEASRRAWDSTPEIDPRRSSVEAAHTHLDDALGLVRQLWAFSQRQVRPLEAVDLNDAVQRAEPTLRRLAGPHIQFRLALGASGLVQQHEGDLEQLLTALVVSARDLLPAGGSVLVETDRVELDAADLRELPDAAPGPHLVVAVTATGYGAQRAHATPSAEALARRCGGAMRVTNSGDRTAALEVYFVPRG